MPENRQLCFCTDGLWGTAMSGPPQRLPCLFTLIPGSIDRLHTQPDMSDSYVRNANVLGPTRC